MEKKDKILITGANGMVGKNLVEKLKSLDYTTLLVPSSKELDLIKREDVFNYFKNEKPDYVIHLAARVGGIKANIDFPVEFLRDNLLLNTNVIDASFDYGVKKLLNLGSSCIYPKNCSQPMQEEYMLSGKFEPTNEGYALSKVSSLKLCEFYNKQYSANFITLIPPNMYGKFDNFDGKKSHVLAALLRKFHEAKLRNDPSVGIWGTGEARREFLYAGDMADILAFSMENINANDLYDKSFINCGSSEEVSIKNLSGLVKKAVGFEGEMIFDSSKPEGMQRKLLDSSRFFNLYPGNFIGLEEGLKKTYAWYENFSFNNYPQ